MCGSTYADNILILDETEIDVKVRKDPEECRPWEERETIDSRESRLKLTIS